MDRAIFDTGVAEDAIYTNSGGQQTAVRAVVEVPDRATSGGYGLYVGGSVVSVLVADIAQPSAGDLFTVGGVNYTVVGEPLRDMAVWRMSVR